MRTAFRFALGLVVGENYEWCLVIVVVFMRFEKAGAKKCGEAFKASIGVAMYATRRGFFL